MPSKAVHKLNTKSNAAEKLRTIEVAEAMYDLTGRCESSFRHFNELLICKEEEVKFVQSID